MTIRTLISSAATALFLLVGVTGCERPGEAPEVTPTPQATAAGDHKRPNMIIVLLDDTGFADLGAYGSEIETPNIDQLAANGVQFTNFHAAAACSPTRGMLMTGVDNHHVGMGNMLEIMADNQFDQPSSLRSVATVTTRSFMKLS